MAIELGGSVNNLELPSIIRTNLNVNFTVTAIGTDTEVITSINVTYNGTNGNNLIINNNTVQGYYDDPFIDKFYYLDNNYTYNVGYEDFEFYQTPIEVISYSNLPPNKEVYKLEQDTRGSVQEEFNIEVNYEITVEGITTAYSTNFIITQQIQNSWDGIYNLMKNYY